MKIFKRLFVLLLAAVTAFSLSSCIDMGVGDEEDAFKNYISSVLLLSPQGRTRRSILRFNKDIHLGDTEIDDKIVPYRAYSYIGFRVSDKDVAVDEFAFFAKARKRDSSGDEQSKSVRLEMEFYVSDKMPTKLNGMSGGDDVYLPEESDYSDDDDYDEDALAEAPKDDEGNVVDRNNEVKEDDLQGKYFSTSMTISDEWSSAYFKFGAPQQVSRGDYIIIKILNNCAAKDDDTKEENVVEFTVNYLMFRFTYVSSN